MVSIRDLLWDCFVLINSFQNWMAAETLSYYSTLDFTKIKLSLEACFKNKH